MTFEELRKIYPKCKYHFSEPAMVVNSPEEEAALGSDWVDHPNLTLDPKLGMVAKEEEVAAELVSRFDRPRRGRPPKTVEVN